MTNVCYIKADATKVLLITVSIIILKMSLKGFGLHYWNVPTDNAVELLKLFYVCQMLYVAVQIFSKVAILALYSRLFPDFIRWFRWSVRAMVAFMVCTFEVILGATSLTKYSISMVLSSFFSLSSSVYRSILSGTKLSLIPSVFRSLL